MNFVGERVKPKSLSRPLVLTAAILGLVQGILWTSLSATSLYYYHSDEISTTAEYLGEYIYTIYLADGNYAKQFVPDVVIGAQEFSYFMYVYLILSVSWGIVSTITLWAIFKDKKKKHYDGTIIAWVVTASLSALLDLILLFILSHDYHIAKDQISVYLPMILSAVGIVMTLAARGFVLWVVNLVFIVVLSKHVHRRYKKALNKKPRRQRSIIDGYSGSKAPWQSNSSLYDDTGFDNRGFRGDQDTFAFPPRNFDHEDDRSSKYNNQTRQPQYGNDYFPPVTPKTPQPRLQPTRDDRYTNNGSLYRHNEPVNGYPPARTAKIGPPSGQRSPPLRVNPPNLPQIPDPDYSPPGSPKVRGVLRPNSNYMY